MKIETNIFHQQTPSTEYNFSYIFFEQTCMYQESCIFLFLLNTFTMSSLVTEKRRGRKKGSKGKCSYCWNVMEGVLDTDHNIRTCPRRKKHEAEQEEMNRKKAAVSTPPRDTTPHYDESFSNAPTPSRSNRFSLRRSPRLVEEASNAQPSKTEEEKLNAFFKKACNIWEDKKPSSKSYGDCLICLSQMYEGDIMVLGCGHKLHTQCAEKLYRRGDNKCPECRLPGVFTMLTRPEPPKDTLRDLEIENSRYLQEVVSLKRQLKRTIKDKEMWERDARSLWSEFVTEEMLERNFIWRNMSKRYI